MKTKSPLKNLPGCFMFLTLFCALGVLQDATANPKELVKARIKPKLEFASLQWGASKRPDGSLRYWNPEPLIDIKATLVSVYYRPMDKNGKTWHNVGMIPPKLLAKTLAIADPELKVSHEHGLKVAGYADTILFYPDMLQAEGIDCSLLYARDANGKVINNHTWERDAGVSCINNPEWLMLQKKVAMVTAQADFDGLMFDIYPYLIPPYYQCSCSHCLGLWRTFSQRNLHREVLLPNELDNLDPATKRTFYEWRMQAYADFVREIEMHVHAKYPDFMILMNHIADLPDFAYQASVGALSNPTTEANHIQLGDESSLYMYRRMEAINGRPLILTVNAFNQVSPAYRYRVAIAEAYAGGGLIYSIIPNDPTVRAYYRFFQNNKDWFTATESDADVAMLYSLSDHCNGRQSSKSGSERSWLNSFDRPAANMLAKLGVPYDHVHLESKQKNAPLARYKTLVSPGIEILGDGRADEIKRFVEGGGYLLCLGNLGQFKEVNGQYIKRDKSVLTEWTGKPLTAVWNTKFGKGRISYLPENTTEDSVLKQAADYIDLNGQISIKADSIVETAIRRQDNKRIIHLIRLGSPKSVEKSSVDVNYGVPMGYDVRSCEVLSPDSASEKLDATWKQTGCSLLVKVAHMDTYAVIAIEINKKK